MPLRMKQIPLTIDHVDENFDGGTERQGNDGLTGGCSLPPGGTEGEVDTEYTACTLKNSKTKALKQLITIYKLHHPGTQLLESA